MITTAKFRHEFGLVKMSQMAQQFLVSGLETYQMVANDMFSVKDIWRALDEVISAITSSMTKLDLLTVQRREATASEGSFSLHCFAPPA